MCSGVNLQGGRTRSVSGTESSDHAGDGVIRAEGTMLKRGRRISTGRRPDHRRQRPPARAWHDDMLVFDA
jgi:hypothetical protein